jgi:HRAS-like suppressor 3
MARQPNKLSRFQYGDHLMVHRPGFTHHGIYVSDDRVIDFGAYDLRAKHRYGVRPVTLEEFAGGRKAEVVQHPSPGRMFGASWLPNPLPPDQIVAKAERLAEISFSGKYTLFGSNCEHVANWCVTGHYFESLQIKKFFRAHAIALLIMLALYRWKGHNRVWRVTYWALLLIGAVARYQSRRAPYKFWEGVEIKPLAGSDVLEDLRECDHYAAAQAAGGKPPRRRPGRWGWNRRS